MPKNIYSYENIKGVQAVMEGAFMNYEYHEKNIPGKRVDIISIKMVKESSILYKNRKVTSPNDAYNLIKDFIECADREELIVCSLDTKNQPTTINVASIGTLNSSLVHPREIFKASILGNAASIIIVHNHPSGDPNPSSEDISITQILKECGKLLGIEVIDHIFN